MSGATVADFLGYWQREGEATERRGDYDWMASLIPGNRVLEIGCGPGYSTKALANRGLSVLSVDALPECLAAAKAGLGTTSNVEFLATDMDALDETAKLAIAAFQPDAVACWLMGAPADRTGASADRVGQSAVVAYRERLHRRVAELATALPGVKAVHLVDRTAIAWQAKDIGRDILVKYHAEKTFNGLPFRTDRQGATYRKIDDPVAQRQASRQLHPSMKNVVPVLASLLAERI